MPHPATPISGEDWIATLREKGLRATTQRLAVLGFLHNNPHANAENIFQGIRAALPTVSIQAVHLIVQDLTTHGILRRITLPGSPSSRYETRINDNHHHIQCVTCGRTEDVDCSIGDAPCLDPSHTHGMRIIEASIIFSGICSDCESSQSPQTLNQKQNVRRK